MKHLSFSLLSKRPRGALECTPCACKVAFLGPVLPAPWPATVSRSNACPLQMRGRRGRPARKGPSRTPRDKEPIMEEIAAQYGVRKAKPGQALDEKLSATIKREAATQGLYASLVSAVGQGNLDRVEKVVFYLLGGIFTAFLSCGLAISSLAFFKATGKAVPAGYDDFVTSVEAYFTPALVLFFALSSAYGLYKQAQLNSGATGYTEKE